MKQLLNHTSFETAYKVDNYPYGFRLRTSIFYWLETDPKKGDRFCSATINPKNGQLNKQKCSTYSVIGFMFLDEKGHVQWSGLSPYTEKDKVREFGEKMGLDNMNQWQRKQFDSLLGINEVKRDEFTNEIRKDYSIKWEKNLRGDLNCLRITFDRPDAVSVREIFTALKGVNQEKLKEVFSVRNYGALGESSGIVRVCVRGGIQLATVTNDEYQNYLASDLNILEEEKI